MPEEKLNGSVSAGKWEPIAFDAKRLRVHGGWFVRNMFGSVVGIFVPDANNEWIADYKSPTLELANGQSVSKCDRCGNDIHEGECS